MSDKWHPRAEWTPAIERCLRQLRRKGHSAAAIAATLNREFGTRFTRSAVIGKIHRLGIPLRRTRLNESIRKPRHAMRRVPMRKMQAPPVSAVADLHVPPLNLTIDGLTATTCRYPMWGAQDTARFYCGHATRDGSPYCAHHHRICHVRPDARAALARAA